MTGSEYKESLQDGRATYFEGERIDDLPSHPLLGQTVDCTAVGYDKYYDRDRSSVFDKVMDPPEFLDPAELKRRGEVREA